MVPPFATRVLLGGLAAALAVVIFHQGMVAILHALALPGLSVAAPYSLAPVPPYGVPRVLDLCFWGGLYGLVFGALLPVLPRPLWLPGLVLGVIAALVGMFVVTAVKGLPAGGGSVNDWARSLLINGAWGLGTGVFLELMTRRSAGPLRAG